MIDFSLLYTATLETLYMVFFSTLLTFFIGIIIGVLLFLTDHERLFKLNFLFSILSFIVNILRSIPFFVLVLLILPLSRILVGTTLGPTAAILPLTIGAAPFFARLVETACKEVDQGIIAAALAMGASNFQLIFRVVLPEALPSIVSGITVTCISLISFSAMVGIIGSGGLGDVAYRFGFQSFNNKMLFGCCILLVLLVQLVQVSGDFLSKKLAKTS